TGYRVERGVSRGLNLCHRVGECRGVVAYPFDASAVTGALVETCVVVGHWRRLSRDGRGAECLSDRVSHYLCECGAVHRECGHRHARHWQRRLRSGRWRRLRRGTGVVIGRVWHWAIVSRVTLTGRTR